MSALATVANKEAVVTTATCSVMSKNVTLCRPCDQFHGCVTQYLRESIRCSIKSCQALTTCVVFNPAINQSICQLCATEVRLRLGLI